MIRSRQAYGAVAVLVALVSCSLTTSLDGFSDGDPATDDGGDTSTTTPPSTGDAGSTDAPGDSLLQDVAADVVDGCSSTGCYDLPAGFSLVAFSASTRSSACPTGFALPQDTVENPSVNAGACVCNCNLTSSPSCATNGLITGHFGVAGGGACTGAGGDLANNGCGTDGFLGPFGPGNQHRYTPPAFTGGSCSAMPTQDPLKLVYGALGRTCQATTIPECNSKVCLPSVGAPYKACIGAPGNVPCPTDFGTKHLIGSSASFTCASGCSCNVTATCNGHLDYYSATDCSGTSLYQVTVANTCVSTDNGGASYGSHKYTPDALVAPGCSPGGSSSPTAPAFTGRTTVCCQ